MKLVKNTILLISAFVYGVSCQMMETVQNDENVKILVSVSEDEYTRVSEDGSCFVDGDEIQVVNKSRSTNNKATFTYDESADDWSTDDKILWEGQGDNEFEAWHPASASFESFTISGDQSAGLGLSDWMTANAVAKPSDGGVALSFRRHLAKVNVKITSWGSEYPSGSQTVNGLYIRSLNGVMYNDGSDITGNGSPVSIKTYVLDANEEFVAIVSPGTYSAGSEIMRIYVNGNSESLSVKASKSLELKSGKAYSFELTVGRDCIEIAPGDVSVTDWDEEVLDDQVFENVIYQLIEGTPTNYTVQFGENSLRVPFQSNVGTDISIEYDGTESGWITYDDNTTSASIINELVFNVASNKSNSTRTARIVLSNSRSNSSIILNVDQVPFTGIDDSSLDKNKYITYVEDYEYEGGGDAFDYDMYYYGTTISSNGLYRSSKIECKFSLNDFTEGSFYISVGEYDDSIYKIYINVNGLNIRNKCYPWEELGVEKTDVITLTLSGTTMVVNGKTITGIPSVNHCLDGYIWSGHYHERDDGMWWKDYTFQDGGKIYYAKGWDNNGVLIYVGGAALSTDGRACWKSVYYDSNSGNIVTEEHFPRVTTSFGRGNL